MAKSKTLTRTGIADLRQLINQRIYAYISIIAENENASETMLLQTITGLRKVLRELDRLEDSI